MYATARFLSLLLPLAALGGAAAPGPSEYTQIHMGVPVRVVLYTEDPRLAPGAAGAAFDRIASLDRMMSDYRPDSELRTLPRGRPVQVSAELFHVFQRAVEMAAATDGAFDPTVGPLVAPMT